MLTEFLQTWPMFQDSYLAALLSGLLLSLLGVLVVGRQEIFLAAAVAQASVLGVALALTLGWSDTTLPAIGLSVLAALLAGGRGRQRRGGVSREEVTAWTFLIASSLTVIVLSRSPVGMKNVQSVLTSTVLGATRGEVLVFAALAAAAAAFVALNLQRLTLLILDPVMAAAVGLSVGVWAIAVSGALGMVTGLAIRATGLLFTFGCLVLPALIAKNLCRRVQPMFLVAPAISLFAILLGMIVALHFDYPPGQMIVAILCLLLLVTW